MPIVKICKIDSRNWMELLQKGIDILIVGNCIT